MAFTVKHRNGTTTSPSVTGTPALYVKGPAQSGNANQYGLYILDSGSPGVNGTYRHLEDVNQVASAAVVTTFTAL